MKYILLACIGFVIILMFTACDRQPGPTNSPSPQVGAPPVAEESDVPANESDDSADVPDEVTETPQDMPAVVSATSAPPSASDAASHAPTPTDSKVATFAGLTAPKPATWIWRPPQRQFSVAEYAVPGRDGHDQARIDVFKAGGSVEMNIDRWRTQFRNADGSAVEPVISTLESDGMQVTMVEFNGEYRGMGMISFAPGQLFLCAIVQAPAEQIFVRFVGPVGTVEPNRQAFVDMISQLKKVEPEK